MFISGIIRYKRHHINFEVRYGEEPFTDTQVNEPEIKHPLINKINQKYRVKYPKSSIIESVKWTSI
ncbi:hypothetical protein MUN89_06470 [Halobacillus salinarum]|uniref:Uncharacterized protein n=1 Tax=Halobacillus salinarum TaxID=2932257 RepID=A0ABY4ENR8_9BACI|nr:hypothetical protein [Halobacillus salinarum]UOQ45582.1 hypothetical protein MUN89_06470 [Halobacillus salinarum]